MPVLKRGPVLRESKYAMLCLIIFTVYYLVFRYLITSSNDGLVLITIPSYLVFALIGSASILLTLSVHSFFLILPHNRKNGVPSGIFSSFSVFIGGIAAGCACQAPILYGFLYFVGLNSLEASGLVTSFADHEVAIIEAMVAINMILIVLFSRRIQKNCKLNQIARQVAKDREV